MIYDKGSQIACEPLFFLAMTKIKEKNKRVEMNAKTLKYESLRLAAPTGKKTVSNPRGLSYGDVVYVTGEKENTTGSERWPNRPAIIISKDIMKDSTVQIVYLSHILKIGRYNINVTDAAGNTVRACCDQIHCVDYSRIGNFLYKISEAELYGVKKAIVDRMDLYVDNHAFDCAQNKREENHRVV